MKKRLLILLAFLFLVSAVWLILPDTTIGTFGINKTVGWAWDISNYIPYIAGIVFIIILIIAIILWAGKK